MKVDFAAFPISSASMPRRIPFGCRVAGETDILTDVLLCPPHHLSPVPCCAVTRESLQQGHATCTDAAVAQHDALVAALKRNGVRCHMLAPSPDLPDMCFTRDVGVATPFGMVALNPAMPHRRGEVTTLAETLARWGVPLARITTGTIEGGDICVARDGLLLLGMSGERSSAAGTQEFATPFRAAGWDVLICPFHADHLHLDTIFCMLAPDEAIGCIELLDPAFLQAVQACGVRVLPVPASSSASLGCNVLALGRRRILASDQDKAVLHVLRSAGYSVEALDISQFAPCGGGIHCLTQPLRRVSAQDRA